MRGSMSRKGDCWDNAVSETLFGSLKVERLHAMRWANSAHWPSRKNGLAIRNGSPHNPPAKGDAERGRRHNRRSQPFTWTADPDKIIAAVRRGRQVLDSD